MLLYKDFEVCAKTVVCVSKTLGVNPSHNVATAKSAHQLKSTGVVATMFSTSTGTVAFVYSQE